MKNLYVTSALSALFLLFNVGGYGQSVSFSNMSSMLGPISGYSYEDCAVDMNGDYLDDVVRVTSLGIYIDYQLPAGGFEQTFHSMLVQNPPTWSICAADINNSGYNDLLFGNGSRVSFVYANASGTAYTEDPHPEYIFSQRSTFSDIDNDGNLDAFVCHDTDLSHPYRNDGSGNLTLDQTLIETIPIGGNYSAIWTDYDNDGDSDLYITKCRGGAPYGDGRRINGLYRNNGDGTYTEVGAATNMNDHNQGWSTAMEDFNNDGWFDAFTVNHSSGDMPGGARNVLMQNNGDGTFTDVIEGSGINMTDLGAWNCDAADFDNNGFVDIFSELSKELYLNNGDGTFTPVDLNFDSGGIADFNGDGFLDVINGNTLWINDGNDNNHVMFSFEGIFSNRNGIGARVEIHGGWGIQVREVRSGTSFAPMKSLNTHFGLGTFTAIDSVVVKWPSGVHTTINNPEINTTHHIPEAACVLESNTVSIEGGSNLICLGETVTLTADPGYEQYQWNTGAQTTSIEVSSAGTYTVTLTDESGCVSVSEQVAIQVVEEDVITLTAQGETEFCQGESVVITTSSGTNFQWNNGATGATTTVTESGIYYVDAQGACGMVTSDTLSVVVYPAPAPVLEDIELTEPGTAILTATGENISWYDAEDATEPIGTGNEFETPVLSEFTVFWAEAAYDYPAPVQDGGKLDNSGGGSLPSTGAYSYFNVWEAFTLQEVTVYVPAGGEAGVREIQLVDAAENVLETASFDLEIGEHVLTLNFEVPVGSEYTLRCPQNNLFRNSGGVSYPYAIGDMGELYDSFYGASYYYYFYNWKVQSGTQSCISDRVPIAVGFTSISDEFSEADLNVYPNPASSAVTVELNTTEKMSWSFEVRSTTGALVWQNEREAVSQEHTVHIDIDGWARGVYFLKAQSNKGVITTKLVVQ